jgi:hypothetical protein
MRMFDKYGDPPAMADPGASGVAVNPETNTDYKCPYKLSGCLFDSDNKCFIVILEAAWFLERCRENLHETKFHGTARGIA